MVNVRHMSVKRLLSPNAPRAPLPWSTLAAVVLVSFIALWLAWMIVESQGLQWAMVVATLFVWNFFLVRSGEQSAARQSEGESIQATTMLAIALLIGLIVLALLADTVISATEDWSLFPGREAIYFLVISLPLMVWVNVHLQER